jgi:hypothetical protein
MGAIRLIIILCLLFAAVFWDAATSHATTPRGTEAPRLFRKANACPSTGKFTGPCPGWVMDHMKSLRCGGLDVPENLWWMTTAEAKVKDTQEDECRRYYQGEK